MTHVLYLFYSDEEVVHRYSNQQLSFQEVRENCIVALRRKKPDETKNDSAEETSGDESEMTTDDESGDEGETERLNLDKDKRKKSNNNKKTTTWKKVSNKWTKVNKNDSKRRKPKMINNKSSSRIFTNFFTGDFQILASGNASK